MASKYDIKHAGSLQMLLKINLSWFNKNFFIEQLITAAIETIRVEI